MILNYLAIRRDDLVKIENTLAPNFSGASIGKIISSAIPYVFGFAGFLLLIYIVFAGYTLLMSKGDSKAVAAAQANLTTGILGFVIIFTSYFIVQLIGQVLGITQFEEIF